MNILQDTICSPEIEPIAWRDDSKTISLVIWSINTNPINNLTKEEAIEEFGLEAIAGHFQGWMGGILLHPGVPADLSSSG
jgi:hypothetical protein